MVIQFIQHSFDARRVMGLEYIGRLATLGLGESDNSSAAMLRELSETDPVLEARRVDFVLLGVRLHAPFFVIKSLRSFYRVLAMPQTRMTLTLASRPEYAF